MGFLATLAFLGFGWVTFDGAITKREDPNHALTVAPGEALRFTVDAPEAGDLMVLAVDPRGAVSPVYPPGAASSTSLPAGRDQLLPVAVTVDDTPGDLWLHAVLCPRRFGPTDLRVGAGAGELVLPAGCASAPFLLRTAAP